MNTEMIKINEFINNNQDIRKCKDYYYRITSGDYSCVNEALQFTTCKYTELLISDSDLVSAKKIVNIGSTVEVESVKRAIDNLSCIYDLLVDKAIIDNTRI